MRWNKYIVIWLLVWLVAPVGMACPTGDDDDKDPVVQRDVRRLHLEGARQGDEKTSGATLAQSRAQGRPLGHHWRVVGYRGCGQEQSNRLSNCRRWPSCEAWLAAHEQDPRGASRSRRSAGRRLFADRHRSANEMARCACHCHDRPTDAWICGLGERRLRFQICDLGARQQRGLLLLCQQS